MKTLAEQLDELIELAEDLGKAKTELAQYERDAEQYHARSLRGRNARKWLPNARKRVQFGTDRVAAAKNRIQLHAARVEGAAHSGGIMLSEGE